MSRQATTYAIVLTGLFGVGWSIGTYGGTAWEALKRHSADAYVNKYNAASGANATSSTYFVTTTDSTILRELAAQRSDILAVEATKYDTLFHVEVSAATRRERVNEMRATAGIGAVFTIPFICH